MKKFILPVIIILIYSTVSIASDWKPGIIYLRNSESVKGEIRIDQELSLVQCRQSNRIRTFSPMQVKLFQFYDQERAENRVYTVVNEHKRSYYPQAKFYELVVTGEITILRKETNRTVEIPLEADARRGREEFILKPAKQEIRDFEYYLLTGGLLSRLESFEDQVLPLMQTHKQELNRYLQKEKIDSSGRAGQMLMIDHYNRLVNNVRFDLNQAVASGEEVIY